MQLQRNSNVILVSFQCNSNVTPVYLSMNLLLSYSQLLNNFNRSIHCLLHDLGSMLNNQLTSWRLHHIWVLKLTHWILSITFLILKLLRILRYLCECLQWKTPEESGAVLLKRKPTIFHLSGRSYSRICGNKTNDTTKSLLMILIIWTSDFCQRISSRQCRLKSLRGWKGLMVLTV